MSQSRQLAAIMFTDIVGYTRIMGNNEDKALQFLSRNRQMQKESIEKFNGQLIKEIGDGILARFNTVSDAVLAAVEIHGFSEKEEFDLRIGIHEGEVIIENNDVFGDTVNIASRIQSAAPMGGILVSEAVHLNVVNKQNINTVFFNEVTLKNVDAPLKLYKVVTGPAPEESSPVVTYNPSVLKSIAVLPFVNMSNDADQEFFSDGISEEILNSLSHVRQLKVAGRTSAFQFKGTNIDLREVGRKLNVTNVLEGSVRKNGKRLRITAQLINVEDGYHLWSERYDRDIDDVFAIQEEIAISITEKLKLTLLEEELKQVKKCCTKMTDAYVEYLRGRFFLARRGRWVLKAKEHFHDAIRIDPDFALAYAGIADACFISTFYSLDPGSNTMMKGKDAAEKCIELDPTLAEPYASLGYYYCALMRDPDKGKEYFTKCLELNPKYTFGRYMFALLYYTWSKPDIRKAIEHCRIAMADEPFSAIVYAIYGMVLASAGRDEEGLENGKTSVELDTYSFLGHRVVSIGYRKLKRFREAVEATEKCVHFSQRHPHAVFDLIELYAAMSKMEEAKQLLEELKHRSKKEYVNSSYIGFALASCGQMDEAIEYFKKAAEEKDPMLITYANLYHSSTILLKDDRFRTIVGLQPEKDLALLN